MKKALLLLVLVCLLLVGCSTLGPAGETAVATPITLSDATTQSRLNQRVSVLEDPTAALTFAQVADPALATQFRPNTAPSLQFGITRAAIWLKFTLDDQSQATSEWALDIPNPSLEQIDLFIPQPDGAYEQQQAGLIVPYSSAGFPESYYTFQLPAGLRPDQPIYLRIATGGTFVVPLTIWAPDAFVQHKQGETLLWGIYFGLLFSMAIYNFFLFLSLRDRNYLYLVLFIAAVSLQTAFLGGQMKALLPASLGEQYLYFVPFLATTNLLFLLLFTASFLEIKRLAPRLNRLIIGLMLLIVLTILLAFVIDRYVSTVLFLLTALLSIGVLIFSGLIAWRRGYKPARYFLLAIFFPFAISLGDPLGRLGVLTYSNLFYFAGHFGNAALITLLSLALADRINYFRQQTEETTVKLRRSEALITQYLDALPVGVAVYGVDAKPRFVNRSALELLQIEAYDPDDGLERAAQVFPLYQNGSDLPYPAEKRPISRALKGVASQLDDAEMEVDGRRFPIEFVTSPIYGDEGRVQYAISVFRDVSQRKARETAVRVAQELYQSVVEKETLLICRFQQDGALTFVNQAYCDYFNGRREEILGSNLFAIFDDADRADLEAELGQLTPSDAVRASDKRVRRDGQTRWLRWTSQGFFGENGRFLEYQATGADITAQKEIEEQLTHYREHLEELVAERAHQERSRLARDLHDSVTQTLFSANLIAEALPLQWAQDQEGAHANLGRLRQLTTGALAEMRLLLLELRPSSLAQTPLTTLIRNLCEAFTAKYSVPITPTFSSGDNISLPAEVKETAYRIAQEALNNIGKHARASQVTIYLSETEAGLTLRIQDDGKGFDLSHRQPDHLGLAIMQERAAEIDAHLLLESAPDAGATLIFEWKNG